MFSPGQKFQKSSRTPIFPGKQTNDAEMSTKSIKDAFSYPKCAQTRKNQGDMPDQNFWVHREGGDGICFTGKSWFYWIFEIFVQVKTRFFKFTKDFPL